MLTLAEVQAFEAELHASLMEDLQDLGLSWKASGRWLTGKRAEKKHVVHVSVQRCDYIPFCVKYDLSVGVNWKDVFALTYRTRHDAKPGQWRGFILASISSHGRHSGMYGDYKVSDVSAMGGVCRRAREAFAINARPFLKKFSDIENAMRDYIDLTGEAVRVSPFPSERSMIAVACAVLYGDRDLVAEVIRRHRVELTNCYEPLSREQFERALEGLISSGVVEAPTC